MPGAQKRIDLAEQALAVRDIPVALQHRLHGVWLRELQLVNDLIVAQRVDHGRGQQASLWVGGHVLALAAQMRGVVLVELVPLAFLAGLAHVARRGNGALRAGCRLLEHSRCEGHDDAADREPNRERNVGEEILEHKLIVPDGKQITQFRGACAHHVGRGRGRVVCPGPGLVDQPWSARALRRDPHEDRVRVGVEAEEGAQASDPRIRLCGGCDEQVVVEDGCVGRADLVERCQGDARGDGVEGLWRSGFLPIVVCRGCGENQGSVRRDGRCLREGDTIGSSRFVRDV